MVKFILLSHGRSGSTLVIDSLAEHPNVRVAGELFHTEDVERRRAFHALNETSPPDERESLYYQDGQDAGQFLAQAVFHEPTWKEIRAVGFKIFYMHARGNPNEKKAWGYLLAHKDIRVIHLVRANTLESFLSARVASITGEWKRQRGSTAPRRDLAPLQLEPRTCEDYFNKTLARRQWARESFRDRPFLEIEYEKDLCARFATTMNDVQDFLSVPRLPTPPPLEKQAQRPPCEMISNYDELKEYFKYTLYEEFFVSDR